MGDKCTHTHTHDRLTQRSWLTHLLLVSPSPRIRSEGYRSLCKILRSTHNLYEHTSYVLIPFPSTHVLCREDTTLLPRLVDAFFQPLWSVLTLCKEYTHQCTEYFMMLNYLLKVGGLGECECARRERILADAAVDSSHSLLRRKRLDPSSINCRTYSLVYFNPATNVCVVCNT